jgi:transposase
VLGGATVKQFIELSGQHLSIRAIARRLDVSRKAAAAVEDRSVSGSDPATSRAGVENCVVLLRELRAQGYVGSYSILKDSVRPPRLGRTVKATMRFETKPGEQAQVDFGTFRSSRQTARGNGTGAS